MMKKSLRTFVVLDLETTGLDAQEAHITEIGAIKVDENGRRIGSFHTMVTLPEGEKVPKFITDLTGITDSDLECGMNIDSAIEALDAFIGDSTVVAQFASFDMGFLVAKGMREFKHFCCTRSMSRLVEPEEKASLKDICARYGINLQGHHRSMADVEATIQAFFILKRILEREKIDFENVLIESADRPLKYIPKNAKVQAVA